MAPIQHAPTLDALLHAQLPLEATIEQACSLLKRRQIRGPEPCALATAFVLGQVVSKSKWSDVDQLLDRVFQTGRKLIDAQPQELVLGNIVRRVMGLIRDEAATDRTDEREDQASMANSVSDLREAGGLVPPALTSSASFSALARTTRQPSLIATPQSMFNLLSAAEPSLTSGDVSSAGSGASTPIPVYTHAATGNGGVAALRDEILDGIEEIKDEIGQADDQTAGFAEGQIRPCDGVLVCDPTRTVEKFLIKAARRKYTLYLVGTVSGTVEKKLTAAKCTIIRVARSSATAYISQVSRVVLDAHSIAVNGGVLTSAGGGRLARAARAAGRTVLVVGGVYRLSPEPLTDPDNFVVPGEPARMVPFANGSLVGDGQLEVDAPQTEFVPASLINIYVTNLGPHTKDYLEAVVADHYKSDDLELYRQ
ncbi:GCD complex subunit gcd7 [Sporothrix eucalyptigena]|uniref:Translation initiation factor eIF2B subunit beta n=1 Tax=Sporothrix eucalyptigena TaxID=1812306 RepID=A0ABP0BRD1_9PEZI